MVEIKEIERENAINKYSYMALIVFMHRDRAQLIIIHTHVHTLNNNVIECELAPRDLSVASDLAGIDETSRSPI